MYMYSILSYYSVLQLYSTGAQKQLPCHLSHTLSLSPLPLQISETPYGTDKHVYTDVGPYKDPDIYPLMTKMGFSLPSGESHLIFSSADELSEEDILAAGLIMLMATKT